MTLRLNGSTSGYTEIDAPAVAGNNTLLLPTGNGTSGQFLQTNGSGALSFASAVVNGSSSAIVSGTAVASTSGTSIDFTGIPSWVKRITVMFNGVSTNGVNNLQVQIGASSFTISGYLGASTDGPALTATSFTTGFGIRTGSAASVIHGTLVISSFTANVWVAAGTLARSDGATFCSSAGTVTLSGTLDRVRIIGSATGSPSDTFDAGSINILYE